MEDIVLLKRGLKPGAEMMTQINAAAAAAAAAAAVIDPRRCSRRKTVRSSNSFPL
jgi:hypothetical protein